MLCLKKYYFHGYILFNMNELEVYALLKRLIKLSLKHADYDHVVALAKRYKAYITGENLAEEYKQFKLRESKEAFEMRLLITTAITPAICSSVMRPFYKVPRSTPLAAKFDLTKDAKNKNAVIEIQDSFDDYYQTDTDQGGVDFYLQNRFLELTFTDPNAWLLTEFSPFDEKIEFPQPRPFELTAAEAYNFNINNGKLQWLHACITLPMPTDEEGKPLAPVKPVRHTLYAPDTSVTFEETYLRREEIFLNPGQTLEEINNKWYIITYYHTLMPEIPAMRVGYKRDLLTEGRTFVNPLNDAMCHLISCLQRVSEYDLTNALHVFLQKLVRLGKICPGIGSRPNDRCVHGYITNGEGEKIVCPTCQGTGREIHESSADIIEVELPENVKDEGFLPLSEFIHYADLPVALLDFQKQVITEFEPLVHQAVFGTTVLAHQFIASTGTTAQSVTEVTATQNDNDMESVYDTLSPFADKYSAVWRTIVKILAVLTSNLDDIVIQHRFPQNIKLKTRQYLFSEFKLASDSGLPAFVIDSVVDELAENIFMDSADQLTKYRIKKQFAPFKGKDKTEIAVLLGDTNVLKETKVLYNYFEEIFSTLELQQNKDAQATRRDLYLLAPEEIQTLIDAEVKKLLDQLTAQNPVAIHLPGLPNPTNLPAPTFP